MGSQGPQWDGDIEKSPNVFQIYLRCLVVTELMQSWEAGDQDLSVALSSLGCAAWGKPPLFCSLTSSPVEG